MKKCYLLLFLCFALAGNSFSQAILQESFEGSFPPAGWTTVNNGSGNNWSQNTSATYAYDGTKSMQLLYNFSNAADAWAFTPALTLNTNPVTITFYSRVRSASYAENLKLTVGTGNTVADQSIVLLDNPGMTNTKYQQFTATYTPTSNGTYYFAFNCYSDADMFYLYVDSVTISQLLPGCSGAPTGGTTIASSPGVCANIDFSLSVNGATGGTAGLTYQWQSSSDNTNWSDLSGEINSTTTVSGGITSPTYYRRKITCGGSDAYSISVLVGINPSALCGCSPDNGTILHSSTSPTIDEVDIPGTTLTNSASGAPANGYTLFNDSTIIPSLAQGVTYTLNTTFSGAGIASVWFDWNQDGTFDASEWTQITTNAANGSLTFTVDPNALLGKTAMRIRLRASGNANASGDACTQFGSGETEDYVINVVAGTACTGTPTPGIAVASQHAVCSGTDINLTVTGATFGATGLSYQWQVSTDNGVNFSDVPSGDSISHYEAGFSTASCYRRAITCSGNTVYSTVVCVGINPTILCPCSPATGTTLHSGTSPSIDSVSITGTNLNTNSTGVPTSGYTFYYDSAQVPTLNQGSTYDLYTLFSAAPTQGSVWIDWNQDGVFDASEYTLFSLNSTDATTSIQVPSTATLGLTVMRIRIRAATYADTDACSTFFSGETEDYVINVAAALPVSLIQFKGDKKDNKDVLTWITTKETNNKGFEILHSFNGTEFSSIGFVSSLVKDGNSTTNLNYHFVNNQTPSGDNYYRLKQIDINGKVSYSEIVMIKGAKTNKIEFASIYPNPAKEKLSLILSVPGIQTLNIVLTDISGRIIKEEKLVANDGNNQINLNVSDLKSGTYLIKVLCNNGCEASVQKFVKQ